ncbi:MAG: DUF87 domain-containing protein [Alphaproteobacteria bacterium]|nr:DUF87 domain-containing protein [Alphaproteobacteria bacterium]
MVKINENVCISGPRVTNFVYNIKPGERYSDYMKLANKMGCYAEYCPKSNSIILEMPNKNQELPDLKKLLKTKEFLQSKYELPVVLGVDVFGNPVVRDLDKIGHILIGGKTGSGKTELLKTIYESVLHNHKPQDSIVIMDTKGVDFAKCNNNGFREVIVDINKAIIKLQEICEIIDHRRKNCKKSDKNKIGRIIVMVDEFADLIATNKKSMEKIVQFIASYGRGVGVHLIMATQHIDKSVITGIIKANLTTWIALKTKTNAESKCLLGECGAELLLPCGDMLLSDAGRTPIRIHVAI